MLLAFRYLQSAMQKHSFKYLFTTKPTTNIKKKYHSKPPYKASALSGGYQ